MAIDATVNADGSLSLVERRTVDFRNGPFTSAYFTVDEPAEQVRDFTVSEVTPAGRVPVNASANAFGTPFRATWYYDAARDEQRTFVFHYRVTCAVSVYADAAQLLWQFVGTGWEAPTDRVDITVHLPAHAAEGAVRRPPSCDPEREVAGAATGAPLQPGETRAWGHGELNGTVAVVDPQTVTFDVTDVAAAQFVEGSILFPVDAVPRAAQVDAPARARILAYEADLAAQANALRTRHDAERHAVTWMLLIVPLLLAALVVAAKLRDRVPGVPRLIEEPPEEDSVEAALLWSAWRGHLSAKHAYRAQILRLARLGAVTIRVDGLVTAPDEVYLERGDDPSDPRDLAFIELLFGDGRDPVPVMHPKTPEKDASGTPASRYAHWWSNAKSRSSDVVKRIESGDARLESVGATAVAIGAAGAGLWLAAFGLAGAVGYWLLPEALIGLVVALTLIPARVPPAIRERAQRLAAFRRYLKRFSDLPKAPAAAVVIWERYLEFAAALGVAGEVEKQVKALIPPEQLPPAWPGAPTGPGGLVVWSAMNQGTQTVVLHSMTPPSSGTGSSGFGSFSSGSGFGGGFSGGGGGGGGGTGGGFG